MSRFPESRYDYKRRMTTRFALAVCGAALLGFVAIAVASSGAKAQNNFPTAGGSRVDGAVIMCLDAGGNAIPGTAAGNCLGAGGGGGGGAITAAASAFAAGALSAGAGVDGWDLTQGAKADAACGTDTGTCTEIALIKRQLQTLTSMLTAVQAAVPAGTNNIGNVGLISQYPTGAVPITISATGTTGATTATLAASALIKTYICGFSIRANATAAATANSTVTGTVTGTLNFTQWTAPLASGIGLTEQIFSPCIPSSAINTGIAVISAAPGTGGVVSVSAWGYQL